jgi:uncharacterized protein YdeI (YjbR/CyaY-like superfamily)
MKPTFFDSPAKLRAWFEVHHAKRDELWVGFHKKDSGKASVTWPESVDEALCVGWIDGIRKGIDATRYTIRFTPRKATSVWSAINTRRMAVLISEKRVRPPGLRAFEARRENRSGIYSYEQRGDQLAEPYAGKLRKNRKAWAYWQTCPASYRKAAGWWVVSAKKEETRAARLARLIELSAAGERIPQFTRRKAQA